MTTPPRAVTPPQIDAVRLSARRSIERWRPLVLGDLPTSAPDRRSREAYLAVLSALDPRHHARYQPSRSSMWCNILSWDATCALGCEVPHWVLRPGGDPRKIEDWNELDANETAEWLGSSAGRAAGWHPIDRHQAEAMTAGGFPVVIAWANRSGSGHVAMAMPPREDGLLRCCAAGAVCVWDVPIVKSFGDLGAREAIYYGHD